MAEHQKRDSDDSGCHAAKDRRGRDAFPVKAEHDTGEELGYPGIARQQQRYDRRPYVDMACRPWGWRWVGQEFKREWTGGKWRRCHNLWAVR